MSASTAAASERSSPISSGLDHDRLSRRRRSGTVLLAVLWVIVGAGALSMSTLLMAREAVRASDNRLALQWARWYAEGCAARARSVVEEALRSGDATSAGAAWSALDVVVADSPLLQGFSDCRVVIRPAGVGADVNTISADGLRRMLTSLGVSGPRADSMADALLDWRDPDAAPRASGAERSWYESVGRIPPSDSPLADLRHISLIRGFDDLAPAISGAILESLEIGGARLSLGHATRSALATLPGFGAEAVERTLALRQVSTLPYQHGPSSGIDLITVSAGLSSQGQSALATHAADVAMLVTDLPEAWYVVVVASGLRGHEHLTASAELRLVRVGAGAAVTRTSVVW